MGFGGSRISHSAKRSRIILLSLLVRGMNAAMVAISSAAISRFGTAATMPYATLERMTRPLIVLDRWPSRKRTWLRSSDLASIINAISSLQPTGDSAAADTILRTLEYKSTWPWDTEQTPAFGEGTWGTLLERLIENAPPILDYYPNPATNDVNVGRTLPHAIEVTFNPLSIVLVWNGTDSAPKRRDFYGPSANSPRPSQPYGTAALMVRKAFVSPKLIQLAGEIFRDSSDKVAENETAATLPGAAAALNQPAKRTGVVKHPHSTGKSERLQPHSRSRRRSPPIRSRRSTDDVRRREEGPDPPPRRPA